MKREYKASILDEICWIKRIAGKKNIFATNAFIFDF